MSVECRRRQETGARMTRSDLGCDSVRHGGGWGCWWVRLAAYSAGLPNHEWGDQTAGRVGTVVVAPLSSRPQGPGRLRDPPPATSVRSGRRTSTSCHRGNPPLPHMVGMRPSTRKDQSHGVRPDQPAGPDVGRSWACPRQTQQIINRRVRSVGWLRIWSRADMMPYRG